MRDRRLKFSYWLARVGLNGLAMSLFWLAVELVGIQFSWNLYWCAFGVYVVLSLGDMAIDYFWPNGIQPH